MKRPADAGKGYDGVVKHAPGYVNPATEILESTQLSDSRGPGKPGESDKSARKGGKPR
jgi:hypothetical protein